MMVFNPRLPAAILLLCAAQVLTGCALDPTKFYVAVTCDQMPAAGGFGGPTGLSMSTNEFPGGQHGEWGQSEFWGAKYKDDLVVIYARALPNYNTAIVMQKARYRAAKLGSQLGHRYFQILYEGANEMVGQRLDSGVAGPDSGLARYLRGWADEAIESNAEFNYRLVVRMVDPSSGRVQRYAHNIEQYIRQNAFSPVDIECFRRG